jgi:hypothetical protein
VPQCQLNWFRAKGELSSGAVDELNNTIRVITRHSFDFCTFKAVEIALYPALGRLPEPEAAHRFCWRCQTSEITPGKAE